MDLSGGNFMPIEPDTSTAENFEAAKKAFPHWENRVAVSFGISREVLVGIRHSLVPGVHFALLKKRICLSDVGVAEIKKALVMDVGSTSREKTRVGAIVANPEGIMTDEQPTDSPRETMLLVSRCNLPNPRLILACRVGDDPLRPEKQYRVRVHQANKFVAGMTIPVRHLDADYYEITHQSPRWRGRW